MTRTYRSWCPKHHTSCAFTADIVASHGCFCRGAGPTLAAKANRFILDDGESCERCGARTFDVMGGERHAA